MNKKLTEKMLPLAVKALSEKHGERDDDFRLVENGKIDKSLRGQISSFGAAVSMGSLLAAAAFFNEQNKAKTPRHKLMMAINWMLKESGEVTNPGDTLFETIQKVEEEDRTMIKEKVLCCAIALKLAMNLFDMGSGKKNDEQKVGDPE